MIIRPSALPGSYERHLLRKVDNPLFGERAVTLGDDNLLEAQRQDQVVLDAFLHEFHDLLLQINTLDGTADSEVVLALKDRLDRAYETASAVAGDQAETKQAIGRLLSLVMMAVRRGAGDDVQAQQELAQETLAREAHFKLLESTLVADLLNPNSVITAPELVPVLLCAARADLLLALQLFDLEQLQILFEQGLHKIESLTGPVEVLQQAGQSLGVMDEYVKFVKNNLQL